MIKFESVIIDPVGFHARPASLLVSEAAKWKSDIKIQTESGLSGNAKSIINLMSLGIGQGQKFSIIVDGEDEKDALEAIKKVLTENKII